MLGGAAVTEEIFPGFKYTIYSYVISLLRPEVIQELQLYKHGLHLIPTDGSFIPMDDGNYFASYSAEATSLEEIRRHSKLDADKVEEFNNVMYAMAYTVKPILDH